MRWLSEVLVLAAGVFCLAVSIPVEAIDVTLTPIGTPTWQPVDFHLVAAPLGNFDDDFAEFFQTQQTLMPPPNHVWIPGLANPGPGAPHPSPYDHEIGDGVVSSGFVERTVFSVSEFRLPSGVWLVCMIVPGTNSPKGSSPDFASGPIIPNSIMPIVLSGETTRDGTSFDNNWGFTTPDLNTITNPATGQLFDVGGWSHFQQVFAETLEFTTASPTPPAVGMYQFNFTLLDHVGNGWNIAAPFRVVNRDLAITSIKPPSKIALTASKPSQTRFVTVTVQNRSPQTEIISALNSLVSLEVHSLSTNCPDLTPILLTNAPQKKLPVALKPKGKFNVVFSVTFTTNCIPDRLASTKISPHADYSYIAHLPTDDHTDDDICPRAPQGIDPNPDGKIIDLGCGGKTTNRLLGADVLTDVTCPTCP